MPYVDLTFKSLNMEEASALLTAATELGLGEAGSTRNEFAAMEDPAFTGGQPNSAEKATEATPARRGRGRAAAAAPLAKAVEPVAENNAGTVAQTAEEVFGEKKEAATEEGLFSKEDLSEAVTQYGNRLDIEDPTVHLNAVKKHFGIEKWTLMDPKHYGDAISFINGTVPLPTARKAVVFD